jgi:GntR family transcriptional regulator
MPDPMYQTIADDLRHQIESGALAPGAQLRTELELRERYGASRNTVRDAIKWLMTRGLVETRPGQGTFVVQKIDPFVTTLTGDPEKAFGGGENDLYALEVKAERRKPRANAPRIEMQQADSQVAGELQVSEGSNVVIRHQQRFIDDTPWSLQTSFYPFSLVERGAVLLMQAADIPQGTVAYLAEMLSIKQAGWHDTITVRAPDVVETDFFKLPGDGRIPVIETRRMAFDQEGMPVRLTVSVYPADRNKFALNAGRVPMHVTDTARKPPDASATATGT